MGARCNWRAPAAAAAGAVVGALLSARLRSNPPVVQRRDPVGSTAPLPEFSAGESSPFKNPPTTSPIVARQRWRRAFLPVVIFATIGVASVLFSWYLYPRPEDLSSPLSPDFMLSVPSMHNEDMPNRQERPEHVEFTEFHDADKGTVNLKLEVNGYLSPVRGNEEDLTSSFLLPFIDKGAEIVSCQDDDDRPAICSIDREGPGAYDTIRMRPDKIPLKRPRARVGIDDWEDPRGFVIRVTLSGIDGVGFKTTKTRATLRFPQVADLDSPNGASVRVWYYLPHGQEYSWNAPVSFPFERNSAMFFYHPDSTPPLVTGIREDLQQRISTETFIAGALIGLAGAALIELLQTLLPSFSEHHKLTPTVEDI